jgi:hypothetical protein
MVSASPTDPTQALTMIADSARRLIHADNGTVFQLEDGLLKVAGIAHSIDTNIRTSPSLTPTRDRALGLAVLERRTIHVEDLTKEIERFPRNRGCWLPDAGQCSACRSCTRTARSAG